jgi:hypothetical protein
VAGDEDFVEDVRMDEVDVVAVLLEAFVKHLPTVGFLNPML